MDWLVEVIYRVLYDESEDLKEYKAIFKWFIVLLVSLCAFVLSIFNLEKDLEKKTESYVVQLEKSGEKKAIVRKLEPPKVRSINYARQFLQYFFQIFGFVSLVRYVFVRDC